MSNQNSQDWEQRLKDLEAEINQEVEPSPVRPFNPDEDPNSPFIRLRQWYQGLATPAKVGIAIVGAVVAISLLNSILRLVTSLIVIGILGVIFFALYKALLANKSS